jgi:hypothetical protein
MSPAVRYVGVMSMTLALACCAPLGSDGPPTADQAARAACRQQAEQSFDIRNRATRYTPTTGRDSPYSGQSAPEIDRGLVDRYSYTQDYQDCLRSSGARQAIERPAPATLPPAPAAAAAAPARAPRSPALAPPAAASPPSSSSDLSRPPALSP